MEGAQSLKLKLAAQSLADLWQEHCSLHTNLFELTCDEYVHLLASDMDKLNETIDNKNTLIEEINSLELKRSGFVDEINELKEGEAMTKLSEVVSYLNEQKLESDATRLEKLNLILLDIVDKIQEQNKKNQVFLNKALISLKELKDSFSKTGKRYETYGANGATRNNLGR